MKYYQAKNWSEFQNSDSLLFFVQIMQEILFEYLNIKKAKLFLNTNQLINEYFETAVLVEKEVISENHLKKISMLVCGKGGISMQDVFHIYNGIKSESLLKLVFMWLLKYGFTDFVDFTERMGCYSERK